MRQLFINKDNLEKDDIDEVAIRVKGLMKNDKDELLLEHNNNTVQFPGGHRISEESLEETLIREVKEETGINIDIESGPFMLITEYCKNYRDSNKNRCNKIYYYMVRSNDLPKIEEISLSDFEKKTDFRLFYVKLEEIENLLQRCLKNNNIDELIAYEMQEVLKTYKKLTDQ